MLFLMLMLLVQVLLLSIHAISDNGFLNHLKKVALSLLKLCSQNMAISLSIFCLMLPI